MTRAKRRGQRLHHRKRRRNGSKPQPPGETVLEGMHLLAHGPGVPDDAPGPVEYPLALGREALEPGTAVDQQDAERIFQLLHACGQGRLRHAADLRGPTKMPFPGQSD